MRRLTPCLSKCIAYDQLRIILTCFHGLEQVRHDRNPSWIELFDVAHVTQRLDVLIDPWPVYIRWHSSLIF